jgi:ABC-2 type transport system ATP-binding protein
VAWTGKFTASFYDEWDTNGFQKLITDYSLSRTKKTRDLSKGQRVKLSLALALSHNPDLAILDEPTAGLDPIVRREVLEKLRRFTQNEERSVIISSHITDDIARIADYLAFMVKGEIVLFTSKDELQADWKKIHYKPGALPDSISSGLKQSKEHMFGRSGITNRFPEVRSLLFSGLEKGEIKVENASLDEILISLAKGV